MFTKYSLQKKLLIKSPHIVEDLTLFNEQVEKINEVSTGLNNVTDPELAAQMQRITESIEKDPTAIIEGFSIIKQVIKRTLGFDAFDVQLITALALHRGYMVEMKTGEGKTLAATFPVIMHALRKKGAHVLTFNDYLAGRDANWMRPVYEFFGLSVASINQKSTPSERKHAYRADITYATAKEVGFDFLRDTMIYDLEEKVQRPFNYVIVDEADAIMIDEARHPLVLAGNLVSSNIDFVKMASLLREFENHDHFEFDKKGRNVFFTQKGLDEIQSTFQVSNILKMDQKELYTAANLALKAHTQLHRDIDYVVKNGDIKIVDACTGRIVLDRKWKNGLQTAVEAKESLEIHSEGQILNQISLQHLVQNYPIISGMTATAKHSAEEFSDFYNLETVIIPPNRESIRVDFEDQLYAKKTEKEIAIIEEISRENKTGRPILVGTLTVKESEHLSVLLSKKNITHQVLNANNDEEEAAIIAEAGKLFAVTISTNMAGRGTDILLGGADQSEYQQVLDLGGLYVIGTNKHESERIDEQLSGRAGRQGDPGSSRFFISMEDDLMIKYEFMDILPKKYRKQSFSGRIENRDILDWIDITQGTIDKQLYDIRKSLYKYSSLLEKQRIILQKEREAIVQGQIDYQAINEKTIIPELKECGLLFYDKYWSDHLETLTNMREDIQVVKLGGRNPMMEFHKRAHDSFEEVCSELDRDIQHQFEYAVKMGSLDLEQIKFERPDSTWTYIIQDNAFGDQLASMLMGDGNIGLQVDFLSGFLFLIAGTIRKIRDKMKKKST